MHHGWHCLETEIVMNAMNKEASIQIYIRATLGVSETYSNINQNCMFFCYIHKNDNPRGVISKTFCPLLSHKLVSKKNKIKRRIRASLWSTISPNFLHPHHQFDKSQQSSRCQQHTDKNHSSAQHQHSGHTSKRSNPHTQIFTCLRRSLLLM